MYLNDNDRALFFKLYFDLLYCVNEKHKIVKKVCDGRFAKNVDTQGALSVREKLFDNPKWIDEYILAHGMEFTKEERDILVSWRRHFKKGEFFVMRNQKKYTVFMDGGDEDTTRLYGVVGLNHPISDILETGNLPIITKALLLPFKDVIIYDGMMNSYNVSIGSRMRGDLNESYKISKEKFGIIEKLPFDETVLESKPKLTIQKSSAKQIKVPDEKIGEITSFITRFCDTYLNEEYTEMSLRLLEKLRRKRLQGFGGAAYIKCFGGADSKRAYMQKVTQVQR